MDARHIIMHEIIGEEKLLLGVENPVFSDAGIAVFLQLFGAVLSPGGLGEDFQDKIRGSHDAPALDLAFITQDDEIRLNHGLVITVQSDINGREQRDTVAVILADKGFYGKKREFNTWITEKLLQAA